MKKTLRALVPALLLLAVTGCGDRFKPGGPDPLVPMPAHVPKDPVYASADEVVAALEEAGLPCTVIRQSGRSSAACTTEIGGTRVENQIQVLNTTDFSRDEVGDSIDSWRGGGNTIVAAGNWFVRVVPNQEARYSRRIAEALDAVVLPPPYPLPDIPEQPAYATVGALADALEKAGLCVGRKEIDEDTAQCGTSLPKENPACPRTSLLTRYDSARDRDDDLRLHIRDGRAPAEIVTAARWAAVYCDPAEARRAADALGAALIHHKRAPELPE
ncbi:hypothetical protein [Streptomyces sp. NPDC057854]|uniref:hypothetical protein n=1 Tax=unclassified Streptomyces TaxID=2593676 RepID=UPI003686741A